MFKRRKGWVQTDLFASPALPDPAGPPRRSTGVQIIDHRGIRIRVFMPEIRGGGPGAKIPESWIGSFQDRLLGRVSVVGLDREAVLAEAYRLIDLDEKIREELCRET